jgi:Outer membrane protein beta-barrel domain
VIKENISKECSMKVSNYFFIFGFMAVATISLASHAVEPPPGLIKTGGFSKGTMFAGGSISMVYDTWDHDDSDDNITLSIFSIQPTLGYFITPNIAIESVLMATKSNWDFGNTEIAFMDYGVGIGAYYYIPRDAFYIYLGGQAVFVMRDVDDGDTTTTASLIAKGGVLYMLTKSIGMEVGVEFLVYAGSSQDSDDTNDSDLSGYSIALGYFGLKAFF